MGGGPISLFDLVTGMSLLEVVRMFMMLLFLAQQEKIDLQQDEDETDVTITVMGV
jgi:chromatin segregation and condensation protein Rec8/ScpA/Scc1 (kleisin family)